MVDIIQRAQRIENFSTGSPFDLNISAHMDGEEIKMACATDSCGILIIEDAT